MTGDRRGRELGSILDELAREAAESVAIITPDDRTLTFSQVHEMAERVRRALPDGGRRVGIRLSNHPASVAAAHAVWSAGCSVVAISHALPANEMERRLEEVRASAFVVPDPEHPDVSTRSGGERCDPEEAVVMFTSGTTGRPKAASLRRDALVASARGIAVGSGLPPDGRPPADPPRAPRLVTTPLAHMAGTLAIVTAWYLGAPLLLCERFSADLVIDLANRHRLTTLGLTPAMVYDLAFHPGDARLPGVKSVSTGTAPLPETTRRRFEERYGVPVLRNYGQTEFAGAIAFERYSDVKEGRRPPASVGRIAPGVEVSIRDEEGREVPEGEVGEIWARGHSQMSGYLRDGRDHTGVHDDGFIATGDLGYLHDGDMLTVVGRVRDLIICGGFNVYPSQVEALLNELPGVAESVVAGVPDERLGEVPVALVESDGTIEPDPDDLVRGLRDDLPPYEVPRRIRVVGSIPRTDNGKLDREAVAAAFAPDREGH